MPKPPRSQPLKTAAAPERVESRAVVAKPVDPRQSGLFDCPLPKWIKPCLPTLVEQPPVGPQWVHEIKWDGYRVSAYVSSDKVILRTRNGHDWTSRFPAIAIALSKMKVRSAVIDGEAVILDARGRSNFADLQAALSRHGADQAVLYGFDLLFLDGEDLRAKPLEDRRAALSQIIPKRSAVVMSQDYAGAGADLFRTACEHELEGIVSKRLDAPYRSGRSKTWLKTKCVISEIFVIVGYQPSSGAVRNGFANLKIARLDGSKLVYVGAVGSGFNDAVMTMLRDKLDKLVTKKCVIASLKTKGAIWVSPDLRAEIAYRGVTGSGELRHASFKGLAEE